MEKHHFGITIDATPEKVWETLWGDTTYPVWTTAFSEGSMAETDWKKGSKVYFTDGKGQGMVSKIEDSIPNKFMSFKHLGMVKDGVEDYESPEMKGWTGATENYTLRPVDGKTELTIDIDIADDHKDYFEKTWPVALNKLKEISEAK